MRIVLNKYNINLYSTGTKNKAFFVERFNYTLGNKFKSILYDSFDWLSLLPKIKKSYNNSYHTTIKMKPKDVNKENERQSLETVYSEFFLRLAIGFYMLIFQPPVNFCSDENIQTIFGTKLEDLLNYRVDYNSISQTVEKVVKKIFLARQKRPKLEIVSC
jgi:hypothetical protein